MNTFEIGKVYTTKTFLGYQMSWKCIKRTAKTIVLEDANDCMRNREIVTKRIKTSSTGEYVVFDASYMGYVECELRA